MLKKTAVLLVLIIIFLPLSGCMKKAEGSGTPVSDSGGKADAKQKPLVIYYPVYPEVNLVTGIAEEACRIFTETYGIETERYNAITQAEVVASSDPYNALCLHYEALAADIMSETDRISLS